MGKDEKDESDNRYHGNLKEFKRSAKKSSEVNTVDGVDICKENSNSKFGGIKREKLEAGVIGEAGQKRAVYIKTKPLIDEIDHEAIESSDPNMPTLEPLYSVQDIKFE